MSISFLFCALAVPFNGILVRYRASYHPKAQVENGSLPPAPSFITMAKRVWRHQGLGGLTKGLIPTIVSSLFLSMLSPVMVFKFYLSPSPYYTRSLFSSFLAALFYIICIVTVYRFALLILCDGAIVTPRKLDPLNAREALHVIYSAHERKNPGAIYQIPGLFPVVLANLAMHKFVLHLRELILRDWPLRPDSDPLEYAFREVCFVLVSVLGTIIVAPLEVITTRLVLQRNYGGPSFDDTPTETAEILVEKPAQVLAAPPQLLALRNENEPYSGLFDCLKTIYAEEGWLVLYRMWLLTFLGLYV
ncbi:mitochondrial carrier domain-containing protein [Mycena galericulata]|nr:mitochondrial carrier domain-containing protein [Mycena galericulata]